MELYRTDHAVISDGHFRSNVTSIMERVVPLGGQLTDDPFGKIVVYRKLPVVQISEELPPNFPQAIKRLPVVPAPELRALASSLSNRLRILITIDFVARPCRSNNCSPGVSPAAYLRYLSLLNIGSPVSLPHGPGPDSSSSFGTTAGHYSSGSLPRSGPGYQQDTPDRTIVVPN